jgi:RNA polymerase sigma factor (sigma-70 family)
VPEMSNGEEAEHADSFEAFFVAEHDRLFRVLCLVMGSAGSAEELVQDAFLRLWERWGSVRAHPDPSGYLYKTAFNLSRNRLRVLARSARRVLNPPGDYDPLAQVEDRLALMPALKRLPPRQRAALLLTDLLDFDSDAAAEILGVKPVTVRVLSSQARAALRQWMEARDE